MHEVEDVESVLGLTPDMTPEEKKKHLRQEFRKWNARVTHSDPKIRKQAERMLELIAEERDRVSKYANASVLPRLEMDSAG